MTPRFVVRSVTGYSLHSPTPVTSYSVLDSLYNYREVRRFYAGEREPRDFARRLLAHEAAAQLEAEYGSV